MNNVSDLHFPPSVFLNPPPPALQRWRHQHQIERDQRQDQYNFIRETIGAIAQPSPDHQVQMSQYKYCHPVFVPIIQPPPPELPYWRAPRVSHTNRVRAFNFLTLNTTTHLIEPDKPTERSPKRRRLNRPLFPPLSHPYCQPTDPLQAMIKPEEPTASY
jgi:hypothetical protein